MSITVTMYQNYSKRNDSTKQPTVLDAHTDFTCTIKGQSSILDPVLDIYLSGTDPADNPAGMGYNYAYIPKWHRYYFITDWSYNNGIWKAYLRVDVLATYKTQIGALSKYVLRSASNYNPAVIDNCMTLLPPDKTIVPMLKNGNLTSIFDASGSSGGGTGGFFIVGIQGYSNEVTVPSIGGVNYWPLDYKQMKELLSYLTSQTFADLIKDDAAGLTSEVVKVLQDPSQYIVSCQWFPWTKDTETLGLLQPSIGYWSTSALQTPTIGLGSSGFTSMSELLSFGSGFNIPAHPQESGGEYGMYLRAAPYSMYTFHLEPWGDIPIDGSYLTDADRISGSVNVDLLTGQAALNLFALKDTAPTKTIPIGRYFAQVGVSVGIAQLIYQMQSYTGTLMAAATGVASAANKFGTLWENSKSEAASNSSGLLGGDFGYTLGSAIRGAFSKGEGGKSLIGETIQDAVSAGLAYMANPNVSGVNGSYLSYYGTVSSDSHGTQYFTNGPYLEVTHYLAADANIAENGRPLRQIVQLNTLSGFIKCADGDHDIPATTAEKNAISSFMTGGFFYE